MRKKVRRSLALLLALTMMVTLVKSEELFVSAESGSAAEQVSSDTEEAISEETELSLPETEETPGEEQAEGTEEAGEPDSEEAVPGVTLEEETPAETVQTPSEETEVPGEEMSKEDAETPDEGAVLDEGTVSDEGMAPEETELPEESEEETQPTDAGAGTDEAKQPEEVISDETAPTEEELLTKDTEIIEEELPSENEDAEKTDTEPLEYIPEEQPEGISVKAYAAKGVLPENARMTVTALSDDGETSGQYSEAQEALENSEIEYDGFVAYDISFLDEDGNEIEPEDGSVQVKFELDADLLPDDANAETLAVQHLSETGDGIQVETVADTSDTADGTVEMKSEEAVVTAEFEVESFSTFTITWTGNNTTYFNLTVHYVEGSASGAELQTSTSNVSLRNAETIPLTYFAYNIDGYSYSRAEWNGNSITEIAFKEQRTGGNRTRSLELYNGTSLVDTLTYNNRTVTGDIYLIYDKDEPLSTIQGVDTAGRVDISVYDYDSNTIGTKEFPFDGTGWTGSGNGVTQGIVNNTLTEGYPILQNGDSLKYLFDENASSQGRVKTVSNANYLFQLDSDGYYYYNSKENFAELDSTNGEFTLYSGPRANGNVPASEPLFLPFNTLSGGKTTHTGDYNYSSYNLNESENYSFGMEIGTTFLQPKDGKIDDKDMVFEFEGDDDVWVFIDDVLVLDLGGVHDSCSGSINFATGEVYVNKVYANGTNTEQRTTISEMFAAAGKTWDGSDYSSHTLKFFYLERGRGGSNCKIKFNLQTIPKGTISFQKDLVYANVADAADFEFSFRTYVDYDGESGSYELYTGSYSVYDVGNPNSPISVGTVGADGIIKLKDGQFAQLNSEKILATSKFYVQETGVTSDKYDVTVAGTQMETIYEEGTSKENGVQTSKLEVGKKPYVVFQNAVVADNQFNLEVKKEMAEGQTSSDTFQVKVLLGKDSKVPYTGEYTLHRADGSTAKETANSEGVISLKAGEYATITGLVGGNTVRVEEITPGESFETPTYAMISATGSIAVESILLDSNGVTGTAKEGKDLGTNPVITAQVTNSFKTGKIEIQKEVSGLSETEIGLIPDGTFHFSIKDADGTEVKKVSLPVTDSATGMKLWSVTAEDLQPGTYTVTETANTELTVGENSYVLVKVNGTEITENGYDELEVTVTADGEGVTPAQAKYTNTYIKQCNLTVSKTVDGNMSDKNEAFRFRITVKDGTSDVNVDGTYGTGTNAVTITNGSFSLKDGQTLTIPNLREGCTYEVTENDYTSEGYETEISKTVGAVTNNIDGRADSGTLTADTALAFTNTKNVDAPTGLHYNWTPYILMLAISLCMAIGLIITGCMKMRYSRRQRRNR